MSTITFSEYTEPIRLWLTGDPHPMPQAGVDLLCNADAATSRGVVELLRSVLRLTPHGVLTQINGDPIEVQP